MRKAIRVITALLAAALLFALWWFMEGKGELEAYSSGEPAEETYSEQPQKQTLRLWYADDAFTDFFNECAVAYNARQNRVRVETKLITDLDYIKQVNDASVAGGEYPDLFLVGNNALERCVLGGLAAQVQDTEHFSDPTVYPQTARYAVTFGGRTYAYPLCFETAALLYNEEYLQAMSAANGSDTMTIPSTIIDIINLAGNYNAPEKVDAIFKWDVSDIFFNYYFIGAYLNMGGPCGDDESQLDVYNQQLISCLKVYQQLTQFFSIDTQTDDYDSLIRDFAGGRIVFTVATSDAVERLRKMQERGETDIRYGVVRLPDSTNSLQTKSLSITDCLVVNGYSELQEEANLFIRYMIYSHLDGFYDRTGKAPALSAYEYSDAHMKGFVEAYENSVPLTKLREASNFWMLLENTFANVWNGADANESLRQLAKQLMIQITGSEGIEIERIDDPPYVDIIAELTGGE